MGEELSHYMEAVSQLHTRVVALERERDVLSEGFDGSERLRIALERENARLRRCVEQAEEAHELGLWSDVAHWLREALEPPVEGVPELEGEARDG